MYVYIHVSMSVSMYVYMHISMSVLMSIGGVSWMDGWVDGWWVGGWVGECISPETLNDDGPTRVDRTAGCAACCGRRVWAVGWVGGWLGRCVGGWVNVSAQRQQTMMDLLGWTGLLVALLAVGAGFGLRGG